MPSQFVWRAQPRVLPGLGNQQEPQMHAFCESPSWCGGCFTVPVVAERTQDSVDANLWRKNYLLRGIHHPQPLDALEYLRVFSSKSVCLLKSRHLSVAKCYFFCDFRVLQGLGIQWGLGSMERIPSSTYNQKTQLALRLVYFKLGTHLLNMWSVSLYRSAGIQNNL